MILELQMIVEAVLANSEITPHQRQYLLNGAKHFDRLSLTHSDRLPSETELRTDYESFKRNFNTPYFRKRFSKRFWINLAISLRLESPAPSRVGSFHQNNQEAKAPVAETNSVPGMAPSTLSQVGISSVSDRGSSTSSLSGATSVPGSSSSTLSRAGISSAAERSSSTSSLSGTSSVSGPRPSTSSLPGKEKESGCGIEVTGRARRLHLSAASPYELFEAHSRRSFQKPMPELEKVDLKVFFKELLISAQKIEREDERFLVLVSLSYLEAQLELPKEKRNPKMIQYVWRFGHNKLTVYKLLEKYRTNEKLKSELKELMRPLGHSVE